MGFITEAVRDAATMFERKVDIGASVPTWQAGQDQASRFSYENLVRDGYSRNEIVYASVEIKAETASEARIITTRTTPEGDDERVVNSRLELLLRRPNPFMSRAECFGLVNAHLDVAGNAFLLKSRSAAAATVRLWPLRPDRVKVIPSDEEFIAGYRYTLGDRSWRIPASEIIHIKLRDLIDDYLGMPPLMAAAGRVDIDNWMSTHAKAFFQNAGIPAGILAFASTLDRNERAMVRRRFRDEYGGERAYSIMVSDGGKDPKYTPMALGLGANGLAMPDLNDVNEARIGAAFRVPQSLIGTKLGNQSAAYANRRADLEHFWRDTMVPRYKMIGDELTAGLADEDPSIDTILFDLDDVQALQEDQDALHARLREDFRAGAISWQEARMGMGYPEDADPDGLFMLGFNILPTRAEDMAEAAAASTFRRQAEAGAEEPEQLDLDE